jgi:hypothetical protein
MDAATLNGIRVQKWSCVSTSHGTSERRVHCALKQCRIAIDVPLRHRLRAEAAFELAANFSAR